MRAVHRRGMAYEILLAGCATLDRMIATERIVRVLCERCKVERIIDLLQLRARVGGDYSLVNRRGRCRLTRGCVGWNRFYVRHGPYVGLWDEKAGFRWMFTDRA